MNRHAPSGFTLTEVLAVIGIIAILSMQTSGKCLIVTVSDHHQD